MSLLDSACIELSIEIHEMRAVFHVSQLLLSLSGHDASVKKKFSSASLLFFYFKCNEMKNSLMVPASGRTIATTRHVSNSKYFKFGMRLSAIRKHVAMGAGNKKLLTDSNTMEKKKNNFFELHKTSHWMHRKIK